MNTTILLTGKEEFCNGGDIHFSICCAGTNHDRNRRSFCGIYSDTKIGCPTVHYTIKINAFSIKWSTTATARRSIAGVFSLINNNRSSNERIIACPIWKHEYYAWNSITDIIHVCESHNFSRTCFWRAADRLIIHLTSQNWLGVHYTEKEAN